MGIYKMSDNKEAKLAVLNVLTSSFANMIGTTIGHPIDTIKIRIQSATVAEERSMAHIFRTTFQHEGMRGFFKGLIAPVIGTTPYNTMIFTTTELIKRLLDKNSDTLNAHTPFDFKNEEAKNFVAGSASGAICIIIYN